MAASLCVALCEPHHHCAAQTFDLSTRSQAAPELAEPSYAAVLLAVLEQEALALEAAERSAAGAQLTLTRAARNCRQLAADLLAAGDRAGPGGSAAILAAFTIASNRGAIDDSLRTLFAPPLSNAGAADETSPAPEPPALATATQVRALAALERFNSAAAAARQRPLPVESGPLDLWLAEAFAPMAEAFALAGAAPSDTALQSASHWVALDSPSGAADLLPDLEERELADLSLRLAAAPIDEPTRDVIGNIVDFLARGAQFPELRPRIEGYREAVITMLDVADAVHRAAEFIGDESRRAYLARLGAAAERFIEPDTRAAGEAAIARLKRSRALLDALVQLHDDTPHAPGLAALVRASETRLDIAFDDAVARRKLDQLALLLERMLTYRTIPEMNTGRELKRVERDLHQLYRDAEDSLVRAIIAAGDQPLSLADPAVSSLFLEQRQLVEDLQRLAKVPAWTKSITAIHPPAAEGFEREMLLQSRGLADPGKRPQAIATLARFERELAQIENLPFEPELQRATPWALAAAAGRHAELLRIITDQRKQWAFDWSRGRQESDAAARLLLLRRLTHAMADAATVEMLQRDADLLNRWSAWELPAETVTRATADLVTRVKLASVAAIEGDQNSLREQLDRIDREAPLARAAGRLLASIEEPLRNLPRGALGAAGQLAHPSSRSAWMLEQRDTLALICRYALEADHARSRGKDATATVLEEFVRKQVEEISK